MRWAICVSSTPIIKQDQSAGPVARVAVEVWDWPNPSLQAIVTLSPGWCCSITDSTFDGDETLWPAIEVITSPCDSPAVAAGDPERTPSTATPPLPCPPDPPNPPNPEEPEEPDDPSLESCTPRKPVAPMCTVLGAWPPSISLAMDSARLIGIA